MSKMDENKTMHCPLCGQAFAPTLTSCPGCPLAGNCQRVCCPNCHYSFPPESKLVNWLRGHFRRGAGSAAEEKKP